MIGVVRILTSMFSGVCILFFIGSWNDPAYEIPTTGFWAMEGNLLTHTFSESDDPLSGPEIFELRDSDGLSIWFGRYIFKDVCISGECKMLKIWMFWDGAGNYLGFQSPPKEPLTKSDHEEFLPADYDKLNDILKDTSSILKALKQEDLIIVPEDVDLFAAYGVDGFTAATQPGLAEVVVENAVYTCYTLWHTVYGPVRDEILKLIEGRLSEDYLNMMLESNKSEYIISAIQNIGNDPNFHDDFYPKILELIKSKNIQIADQALNYFNRNIIENEDVQVKLIQIMQESDVSFKYKILWKLIEVGEVYDRTILDLLHFFSEEKHNATFYNLCLQLITSQQLEENEEIFKLISMFAESETLSIRNASRRFLKKHEIH